MPSSYRPKPSRGDTWPFSSRFSSHSAKLTGIDSASDPSPSVAAGPPFGEPADSVGRFGSVAGAGSSGESVAASRAGSTGAGSSSMDSACSSGSGP